MAKSERIVVGDIGTKLVLDVGLDISSSTDRKILYMKPSGVTGEWPSNSGSICELNTSTSMYYITESGDIDESGEWTLQAYIETPTWSGHGQRVSLFVDSIMEVA
jgi:hypothetical protein